MITNFCDFVDRYGKEVKNWPEISSDGVRSFMKELLMHPENKGLQELVKELLHHSQSEQILDHICECASCSEKYSWIIRAEELLKEGLIHGRKFLNKLKKQGDGSP